MWLVGTVYNFCWEHRALQQIGVVNGQLRVVGQTPAMAAGLTDHCWTMVEFLRYAVPLPLWTPPKRRGGPRNRPRREGHYDHASVWCYHQRHEVLILTDQALALP